MIMSHLCYFLLSDVEKILSENCALFYTEISEWFFCTQMLFNKSCTRKKYQLADLKSGPKDIIQILRQIWNINIKVQASICWEWSAPCVLDLRKNLHSWEFFLPLSSFVSCSNKRFYIVLFYCFRPLWLHWCSWLHTALWNGNHKSVSRPFFSFPPFDEIINCNCLYYEQCR